MPGVCGRVAGSVNVQATDSPPCLSWSLEHVHSLYCADEVSSAAADFVSSG
jgi:hypothetical protein